MNPARKDKTDRECTRRDAKTEKTHAKTQRRKGKAEPGSIHRRSRAFPSNTNRFLSAQICVHLRLVFVSRAFPCIRGSTFSCPWWSQGGTIGAWVRRLTRIPISFSIKEARRMAVLHSAGSLINSRRQSKTSFFVPTARCQNLIVQLIG